MTKGSASRGTSTATVGSPFSPNEMPAWTRDYQKRAPVSAQTPQAYAAALNTALGEILTELSRDLAAAELKKSAN